MTSILRKCKVHSLLTDKASINQYLSSAEAWLFGSPDIVTLFPSHHIHVESYNEDDEDFGSDEAYKLDEWVFEKFEVGRICLLPRRLFVFIVFICTLLHSNFCLGVLSGNVLFISL